MLRQVFNYHVYSDVVKAALLIAEIYRFHSAGGNLHVIIDDKNVDDSDLDSVPLDELNGLELNCLRALKKLSVNDRLLAIHFAEGIERYGAV